jgi:hypothetical protein
MWLTCSAGLTPVARLGEMELLWVARGESFLGYER